MTICKESGHVIVCAPFCNKLNYRIMSDKTFAQEAIQRRIEEKQRPLRFQDFGYGDEYSEAPYNDYNDCHGDYYDADVAN